MKINTKYAVSVIIPCRNEINYIEGCLRSILSQVLSDGKLEIIVVDGMSDDGTREVVKRMMKKDARIKLVDNLAKTTPQAMNLGLATAESQLVLRIDAHAEATPGFIEKNMETIQSSPDVMCAGGAIINVYQNKTAEEIGLAMGSVFGVGNATFRTGGSKQFVDTLAFGVYKKEIFDKIGNFNEELIRNQDDELNYRITEAGYKILYDPSIQSKYFVRGSIEKLNKQYYQYGYWKVYVNKLHKTITTLRQLVPLLFVISLFIGVIISIFFPPFTWLLISGLLLYTLLSIVAGYKAAGSFSQGLRVARVFPVLHFSYGWGYLRGIVDFLILGKKPSNKSKSLTRN